MKLEATDIEAELGGRAIVRVPDLRLTGPNWVGIVGANGSGKTTLLRALGGRLSLTCGSIRLDGVEIGGDRRARAMAIGFSPDIAMLPGELTGRELLALAARATGGDYAASDLAGLREALDLPRFWSRRVDEWSAGMRQRLALYAAFVGGQRIVLLDEPFNWLDPVACFDARQALANMARDGWLIVSALHDLTTLIHHCREGFLMAEGSIRLAIAPEDIARGADDARAFEHRVIAHLRPQATITE